MKLTLAFSSVKVNFVVFLNKYINDGKNINFNIGLILYRNGNKLSNGSWIESLVTTQYML